MRTLLGAPWRLPGYLRHLYRRRISVQLIFSHLLVMLLTAALLEFVVGSIYFVANDRSGTPAIQIGDWSDSAAHVLQSEDYIHTIMAGPDQESAVQRNALQTALDDLIRRPIAYALITDRTGIVIVSSNPTWAPAGEPVEQTTFKMNAQLVRRVLELDGKQTVYGNLFVQDVDDVVSYAARPILAVDGSVVGVVALQSIPRNLVNSPRLADLLLAALVANASLLVVIGIPVLLTSIPVSIWEARSFSKRLRRVAQAAEAMAHGDLQRRIEVTGEDEISQLAMQFNDVIERLEKADHSRKAFIANVSHDLRTPLAIIQGNLERLLEADPVVGTVSTSEPTRLAADPVPDRQALETIQREAITLNRLIDDLFTLARLEEAVLPLESAPVHLHELVSQAIEGVRSVAWKQRKVTVQSLVREHLPPVLADRIRLGQILGNLLHNALRHTPEGGLVIVDAAPAGGVVEVSVSDTGIGIPPEELDRVFDRFYQVEHGSREAGGSGLGLSIVKQLVEAQHGTITVESHSGQGTTFRFSLPVATP